MYLFKTNSQSSWFDVSSAFAKWVYVMTLNEMLIKKTSQNGLKQAVLSSGC